MMKPWQIIVFPALVMTFAFVAVGYCEEKPLVRLTVSPKASLAGFHGSVITLRLVIENADEKHWCPKVVWVWPSGTESSEESDCVQFSEATDEEKKWQSWTRRIRMPQGDWTFSVRLEKAGKVIKKVSANVSVR